MLPIAVFSSSGYSIVSIIALRRRSVSLGTCSMYSGQTSTQALQVVQAQTASSVIRSIMVSPGCSPASSSGACSFA